MQFKVLPGRHAELRRLALQLAVQLPDSNEDARVVIDELAELLEHYVVRGPRSAWRVRSAVDQAAPSVSTPAAIFWTAAAFLVLAPLAAGMAALVGLHIGAALVFFVGIAAAALVFGPCYGLGMSAAAVLAHNLLIIDPVLRFSRPCTLEIAFAVGYAMTSLLLPWLAVHGNALRARAVIACARPRPSVSGLPLSGA